MKLLFPIGLILFAPAIILGEIGRRHRGTMYTIENEHRPLDKKNLMILDLTLWDSTFQDAQVKIGASPIQEKRYRGGSYDSQMCYEGRGVLVLFDSQAERDTPQEIQNVIISTDKYIQEAYAPCTVNPKISKDLTFAGGLRLGMSRADVRKIWGRPGKATPKVFIYEIRRMENDYFTDDVSIYLEFKNDKLTFAQVERTCIR